MGVGILVVLFLFALTSPSTACPQNCLFCLEKPSCSACTSGFVLTTTSACLRQTIPNCRVQLDASSCSICEATFQVSGGQCVKDYSGCVIRSPTGSCKYCWFGTRLNADTCTGILNCQTYQPNGQCSQCATGYSLSGGNCIDVRTSCALKSNGICIQCQSHYTLNGFSCLPEIFLPPGCSLFDFTNGRCLICLEGFEIYHKYCQRKDYIPLIAAPSSRGQNAISMQVDVLGGQTSSSTNSMAFKSDSIVQDYVDISIKVIVGQGQGLNNHKCWQRDQSGNCVLCYQGYYLANQTCVKSSPLCLQFDPSGMICTQCIPELVLNQGNCIDNNCAVPIFSRCSKCLNNYSPNAQGICVISNCISLSKGICTKCSQGYTLSSANQCVKSPASTPSTSNNNLAAGTSTTSNKQAASNSTIVGCDLIANGACVRCSPEYYPNNKGGCKRVIIGCLQYDAAQLNCLQCISVYTKTNDGNCVYEQTPSPPQTVVATPQAVVSPQPSNKVTANLPVAPAVPVLSPSTVDQNCLVRNNGSCGICKTRYIINPYNFTCQLVPKECLTYNSTNGNCLSCAQGFILFQLWCLSKTSQTDPNCVVSDINNYCTTCQAQYFQSQGRCYAINSQCKTLNTVGGDCTSCYSGYIVINGACVLLSQQPSCVQYDFQSNCIRCAQRYFLQSLICTPVSPLCNNYNSLTGSCVDCVAGYGLSSITSNCEVTRPTPPNCQTADPVGNCLACLDRFYFNSSNACVPASALCSKFVANGGKCLACFTGYNILSDSSCVQASLETGCKSAAASGLCSSCSSQYILNTAGSCVWRDPNCLTYDDSGVCNKCTSLYYVWGGKCVKKVMKSKDPNCLINDLMNFCLGCNPGYYISAGNCLLADQLCPTFDPSNGNCLTCYSGYRLYQNKCFLDNPIFNCQQFNGSNCVLCETGYSVKSDGSCAKN